MARSSRSAYPPDDRDRRSTGPAGRVRLAGCFMALFLPTCLLLSAANPALLESPEESLLDGSWAEVYQEEFDQASPLLDTATAVWAVLEYGLFREGRPGVLVGSDDWLFSSEEFAYPSDDALAQSALAGNLEQIESVSERLAQQGAQLIVSLVPAKARIYPDELGRYQLPDGPRDRYQEALSGLQERGIDVVDLARPLSQARLQGEVFLRTDTHWTPFGARIAAQAVSDEVRAAGFDWLDQETFATTVGPAETYRGDLTSFLPLGPLYDRLGPRDDRLRQVSTRSQAAPGGDLFAEVTIPVVLVGTSYSEDEKWNFAGSLREALGSDVLQAARQGQGPYEPMLEYLAGEAIETSPPSLVIWEVPERYLTQPWGTEEETS